MSDAARRSWTTTTHSWVEEVDPEHLRTARRIVGEIGPSELVHMVLEIVAYADDEAADQKRRGRVAIEISADRISVMDDGRGTDTRRDSKGVIVRKPVMATPDLRFFGREGGPSLPDDEPRRGMSAVAASCEELIHENYRQEGAWAQTYRFGVPATDLAETASPETSTGTTVRLHRLDPRIVAAVEVAQLESLATGFAHVNVTVTRR